jgi:hypothetical protein
MPQTNGSGSTILKAFEQRPRRIGRSRLAEISIGPQLLKRPNYFRSAKDLVQLLKHSMRLSLRRML